MKAGVAFVASLMVIVVASVLGGCLITASGAVDQGGGGGWVVTSGTLSSDDDHGVFSVAEAQQRYHGLRFAASDYPVDVYRVVLFYRGGGEESFAVDWRFTDRVRYHDLRVPGDRDVREIQVYQRRQNAPDRRDQGNDRGGGGDRGGQQSRRNITFTVYGLQ